ncbi:MAG TPA: zf-HC2 domain-containing protein [Solirubrobacteraceae bacterium]|nr:zf-HC2 domain-containing protein [Solirubrobacteraceae bacterium]
MPSPFSAFRFRRDHAWTPAHLAEYLEDGLPARRRMRVRRHVGDCTECRRALLTLGRGLSRLPEEHAEEDAPVSDTAIAPASAVCRRRAAPDPPSE